MKYKRALTVVGILAASYVAVYATAFHFRSPAANLAYWCYTPEEFPSWTEDAAYATFYPAYAVQRAIFDGPRHNFDREKILAAALAQP